jgi:hypothetical protein
MDTQLAKTALVNVYLRLRSTISDKEGTASWDS